MTFPASRLAALLLALTLALAGSAMGVLTSGAPDSLPGLLGLALGTLTVATLLAVPLMVGAHYATRALRWLGWI